MISRRMLVLTGFALVAAVPALAKEPVTWDEAAFDAAKAARKPILLEFMRSGARRARLRRRFSVS